MEFSHPVVWVKNDWAVIDLLQLSPCRLLNWNYSNERSSSTYIYVAAHRGKYLVRRVIMSPPACRSVAELLGAVAAVTLSGTHEMSNLSSLSYFDALLWQETSSCNLLFVSTRKYLWNNNDWFPRHYCLNATKTVVLVNPSYTELDQTDSL